MDIEECDDPEQQIEGEVFLGSITFSGELNGCLTICCCDSCAKTIGVNMLGVDTDEQTSNEDICDAIGEVTNMVMGSIKSRLQDKVANLQVSIPVVVSGQDIRASIGEDVTEKFSTKVIIDSEYVAEFSILYKQDND
jgi:CheY-specific phosphatase CheX